MWVIARQCKACHLLVAVRVDAAAVLIVVVVVAVKNQKSKKQITVEGVGESALQRNTFPVSLKKTCTET